MRPYRLFGLLLILFTGCRSGQVAFEFQPAPPPLARRDTAPIKPVVVTSLAYTPTPARRPTAARLLPLAQRQAAAQGANRRTRHAGVAPIISSQPKLLRQRAVPRRLLSAKGSFLQVLGTAFAVGGIVLGVVVGGWAGFGLFVLCALAGLLLAFWGSFVIDGELP